jgi:hypothetical protein
MHGCAVNLLRIAKGVQYGMCTWLDLDREMLLTRLVFPQQFYCGPEARKLPVC